MQIDFSIMLFIMQAFLCLSALWAKCEKFAGLFRGWESRSSRAEASRPSNNTTVLLLLWLYWIFTVPNNPLTAYEQLQCDFRKPLLCFNQLRSCKFPTTSLIPGSIATHLFSSVSSSSLYRAIHHRDRSHHQTGGRQVLPLLLPN